MRRTVHISGKIEPLFGTLDENLRLLESELRVRTQLHDKSLTIDGEQDNVERAVRIFEEYNHLTRGGRSLSSAEVKSLIRVATEDPHTSPRGIFEPGHARAFGKKNVMPKSAMQRRFMEDIETHDMAFAVGPGGTGKTYLAVAMAVSALLTKQVNRIILAQVAPLAFMRGRTLNDSFVILDEAQNTTSEQMKMFLTRLGFNSKAVITGDITQIDLPTGKRSGLIEALDVCGKIEGIAVVQFSEKDVVRHNLVQQIIRAYEEHEAQSPRGGAAENGKPDSAEKEALRG